MFECCLCTPVVICKLIVLFSLSHLSVVKNVFWSVKNVLGTYDMCHVHCHKLCQTLDAFFLCFVDHASQYNLSNWPT